MDDAFIEKLAKMKSFDEVELEYLKILNLLSQIGNQSVEDINAEIERNLGKGVADILDGESE